MLASWGSSDFTITASGSGAVIHAGAQDCIFTPGTVGLGVPLPTIVAEYEVTPYSSGLRPVSESEATMIMHNFVSIGYGDGVEYNIEGGWTEQLIVYAPSEVDPVLEYSYSLWIDWNSNEQSVPIAAGNSTQCFNASWDHDSLPASTIWSFGSLLTYPGIPTIG